jgi:hypothetical protein
MKGPKCLSTLPLGHMQRCRLPTLRGFSADDHALRVAGQLPELLSAAGLPGTCPQHVTAIRCHAGTLNCAWPGCTRRAWDCKGLCSFHWKVAFRLIEP